jgi:hypothetical protein
MWHIQGRGVMYTGFWWGNLRDRDHLEDPGIDIKLELQEVGCGGMDCIDPAQVRYGWRALVNTVMNLWIP